MGKTDNDFFYVELLKDNYNNMLQKIQTPEFQLTESEREEIEFLLSLLKSTGPFLKVKDVLTEAVKMAGKKIEKEMEKDIKEIQDMISAAE
ncbi:unnamed protein product [Dimorphilus gyrociliatus]|uniref:Uncharacterized protein n=1 Tax=Dimorphilus gyrociliatus TaxID=2664684 RepID=A0A7I8WE76_9ANNE|nr:unnamed protein product [Dimorphilus gyrociliatus]